MDSSREARPASSPDVSVCGTFVRLEDKAGIRPANQRTPMFIPQESIINADHQAIYEVLTDGQPGPPAQALIATARALRQHRHQAVAGQVDVPAGIGAGRLVVSGPVPA